MMLARLAAAALLALLPAAPVPAQTFRPQSAAGLSVVFQVERVGGSRVLLFGDVRNSTGTTCERVILLVEGLDEAGKVVSRSRGYVHGSIPPKGSTSFEVRLLASGSEKRYRVEVESFQFLSN
jgi:hypothetical protein